MTHGRTQHTDGRCAAPLLALLLLVVAACGAGGPATQPPSPAQAVRDAYRATAAAGGSRVTLASRTSAAGQNVDLTGDGALDLAAGSGDLTLRTTALPTGGLRALFVGPTVYVQIPPALAAVIPGGAAWASIDLDRLPGRLGGNVTQLGGAGAANPARQLGYLDGLRDDARVIGPDTIDGTPTTHYAGTVDLDRVPGAQDPANRPAIDRLKAQLGTASLPVEAWVDPQGRLRRTTQTVTSPPQPGAGPTTATSTLTFTQVGVPVSVTPPPADQVSDLGRLLPSGSGPGG